MNRKPCIDVNQYLNQGRDAYLHSIDSAKSDADFIVDGGKSVTDIVIIIEEKLRMIAANSFSEG